MAEFKEGNLLVADDKGIFFGDGQPASITYDPITQELVFSAFRTTGLTQTWYTNRVVGDTTIASGTRYIDVDFAGEEMPSATYTLVFQLMSNDWYPAVISKKTTTGFRIELWGTAREDIEVNFMAHANQIDNGFCKSYLNYVGTRDYTYLPIVPQAPQLSSICFYSQELVLKTDPSFEVRPGHTVHYMNNYFPMCVRSNNGDLEIYCEGTPELATYSGSYSNNPISVNTFIGSLDYLFGEDINNVASVEFLEAGALTINITVPGWVISVNNHPLFVNVFNLYDRGDTYCYTVQKNDTYFTVNFHHPVEANTIVQYSILEGVEI